jgi:drug/metabolite transporter (DMT)-like permease
MRPRAHGILLALAAAVLFGLSTPASKLLLDELGPLQLAGLLYLGAALGTAPSFLRGRSGGGERLDGRNRLRLAGAVILGGIAGPVLLLLGLRLTLAGSVSLLLNLEVVATAVLGVAFFRDPLGRLGWLGVAGVIAAGVVISWGAGWPGWLAAALVAAACLCWGLDNHLTALIDGITPARSTFWKGGVAGATNLGLGLAFEPWAGTTPVVAAALVVGALSFGASISLYIASAQQLGATRAQAFFASAPFIGAALAFGLLGEPMDTAHGIGAVLLALSVLALLSSRHEHLHDHPAVEHVHAHRHDDGHHDHTHEGPRLETRHSHWHRHEPVVHSHPHWPDLHHRHGHAQRTADE